MINNEKLLQIEKEMQNLLSEFREMMLVNKALSRDAKVMKKALKKINWNSNDDDIKHISLQAMADIAGIYEN